VPGKAGEVVRQPFTLAGVDARADLNAERSRRGVDGQPAASGARWAVEDREHAVAGRLDELTAMARHLLTADLEMGGKQVLPPVVADPRCPACRLDAVGDQHGCQEAVRVGARVLAREKRQRRGRERVEITHHEQVVRTGEDHEPRVRDVLRQVAGVTHVDVGIVGAVQHQGRDGDLRKDGAHVGRAHEPHERGCGPR
jgi:hypothetical protein